MEGKTVLKFALCYGFRNLQNIVRKIKIGKCDYHFLEIMACPSGMFLVKCAPYMWFNIFNYPSYETGTLEVILTGS